MAFESTISAVDRFVGFGQVEAKEKNHSTFQTSVKTISYCQYKWAMAH